MVYDRLTSLALRRARQRVATPVIIKARYGMFERVLQYVLPYHEIAKRVFSTFLKAFPTFGVFRAFWRFNMVSAYLDRETIFDLAEDPSVEKIYSDEPMFILSYPTLTSEGIFEYTTPKGKRKIFTSTYYTRHLIGADRANMKGFKGQGITVAVVDTGAARFHRQLPQVQFETVMPAQQADGNGHGTWCATCIAGILDRDDYLSVRVRRDVLCMGMAPEVKLIAIKALGYVVGTGSTSQIIAAIDVALNYGADVISMSLGGDVTTKRPEDDPYYDVFETALSHGAIPVVAAGNSGPEPGTINSPGALPQALTVGAYNPITGKIADFSSRGPTPWNDIKPDTVAPGVNIDSGTTGYLDMTFDKVPSGFTPMSGTSMATPHIAGLVALMKEAMRKLTGYELTVDEIKRMLAELGHPKTNEDGWGPLTWEMFEHWLSTEYGVEI